MCIVNHATRLNGSCTIKNTDDLKTLLGQNGSCMASFLLFEQKDSMRGGWRWGRSRQTKFWNGSSFQQWIKRRQAVVGLVTSVTRPKNPKGECTLDANKQWNGETSIIRPSPLVPLSERGTNTLKKLHSQINIKLKDNVFPCPPLWCEDYTESPLYEWPPHALFSLLFSLSIGTKPLKSHTVLSIQTKTT